MKGMILVPAVYRKNYVTDRFVCLYNMLKSELGFDIQFFTDSFEVPRDVEKVIATTVPHHWSIESIKKLTNLDKSIKLVCFLQDPRVSQTFVGGQRFPKNPDLGRMLWDKFNVILSISEEKFKEWFPQYINKFVFFPNYFAPHERYTKLKFNKSPKLQCLLTGIISGKIPQVYPLRKFIRDNRDPRKVVYVRSPKSFIKRPSSAKMKHIYVGDRFAELLHSYFCCVTDSASKEYNYVLTKRLEISATGSLLLVDECEDSKKMGFIPYEHYIPITKSNVFSQIDKCLDNPTGYTKIRKNGMNFVRQNHSVNNRFELFKKILKEL